MNIMIYSFWIGVYHAITSKVEVIKLIRGLCTISSFNVVIIASVYITFSLYLKCVQ